AALVPKAELDGDMGDSLPGLQARLMSQALRKLTAAISRSGSVVIFINQIREKIGVMFGCLHYDTRKGLADGTRQKSGRLVKDRRAVKVLSFDSRTGEVVAKPILNWFDNGQAEYFLQFEVRGGPARRRCFAATPNHMILTPDGEIPAEDLRLGDQLLFALPDYEVGSEQWQILIGGTLGDGSLRMVGQHSAHFRVAHAPAQKAYLEWKHAMLRPFSRPIGPVGNGVGFSILTMPALADLHAGLYNPHGCRTATRGVLDRLDARGLAVWYGDDGSYMGSFERWGKGKAVLYNKSLRDDARAVVMATLARFGFDQIRDDGRGFWFSAKDTDRLHALIAPHLHPSVDYKLHPNYRGRFAWQPDIAEPDLNTRRRLRV